MPRWVPETDLPDFKLVPPEDLPQSTLSKIGEALEPFVRKAPITASLMDLEERVAKAYEPPKQGYDSQVHEQKIKAAIGKKPLDTLSQSDVLKGWREGKLTDDIAASFDIKEAKQSLYTTKLKEDTNLSDQMKWMQGKYLTQGTKDPDTILSKIKNLFSASDAELTAKSQNILSIHKNTGLPINEVEDNYYDLVRDPKATGVYLPRDPTATEVVSTAFLAPILIGLTTHPIGTVVGVGTFAALDAAIPTMKFVPSDASDTTRSAVEVIDFVAKAALTGGLFKVGKPLIKPMVENFTKDKLIEFNLPRTIRFSKEQVRDIYKGGQFTNAEREAIWKDLDLPHERIRAAALEGVTIDIPAEKIITITDKPYWSRLKSVFGAKSDTEVYWEFASKPVSPGPAREAVGYEPGVKAPIDVLAEQEALPKPFKPEVPAPTLEKAPVPLPEPVQVPMEDLPIPEQMKQVLTAQQPQITEEKPPTPVEVSRKAQEELSEVDRVTQEYAKSLNQEPTDYHKKFAQAITDKNIAFLEPIIVQASNWNKKSQELFVKEAGISWPTTIKGKRKALYDWAGKSLPEELEIQKEQLKMPALEAAEVVTVETAIGHAKERGLPFKDRAEETQFLQEFKQRFDMEDPATREAYGELPVTTLIDELVKEWKGRIVPLKSEDISGILEREVNPYELEPRRPAEVPGIDIGREERPEGVIPIGGRGVLPLEGTPAEIVPGLEAVGEAELGAPERGKPDKGRKGPDDRGLAEAGPQLPVSVPDSMGTGARRVAAPSSRGGRGGAPAGAGNYRITPADTIGTGTPTEKFNNNVAAITTLKRIEAEGRMATPVEQTILVKYIGWGSMPEVFDADNEKASKKYGQIKDLLTEPEYEAARASTTNAHFTSGEVITAIYSALKRLGFNGGRTLEPSMGVGHFFGLMPADMISGSSLTGVELDHLTGRIARQLYQSADIRIKGYETVKLPDNFYDIAVGNVPFGDYKLHDPDYNRFNFPIHDYFFAKAIDKVSPGGVLAFITSRYTMDKLNSSIRNYLQSKADFIGAVRLPNTAFKGSAGTQVITDIIFLQKREAGQKAGDATWLASKPQTIQDISYNLNEYYVKHPDMMLGKPSSESTMYAADTFTLKPHDTPLKTLLEEAIKKLPENIFRSQKPEISEQPYQMAAPAELKQAGITVQGNQVYQKIGEELIKIGGEPERISAILSLRDVLRDTISNQLKEDVPDKDIVKDINALNTAYDKFVKKYGSLSSKNNKNSFDKDPDYPLLRSLENVDPNTGGVTKADILSKRTLQPVKKITSAANAKDALNISLAETGKINFDRMAQLTGKSVESLKAELRGLIFNDPEVNWITADEYLSGNVKKKLEVAKSIAEGNPEYIENVEALESVQPEDLKPGEIEVRLGATWVPPEYIDSFIVLLLGEDRLTKTSYIESLASWLVQPNSSRKWALVNNVGNNSTWGTDRITGIELIEMALNGKSPTIRDRGSDGETVVNKQASEAAREKLSIIKERFAKWVWEGIEPEDTERINTLLGIYNERFNNIRLRAFDGAHLTLPGINPVIVLSPAQKNAIWRIMERPNTLLAHAVGAGKTFVMISAGMEMRRIGLRKKPMYVVPNHLVSQWEAEFIRLYPTAKILTATKEDFTAKNRKLLMSKIATGDWDGVIVAHSQFARLPMSEGVVTDFLESQIRELEDTIEAVKQEEGRRSQTVKEIEKAKKRLEAKLKKRLDEESKDNAVTFEETGVDQLFIDESQAFKNLFFNTKMQRVAGLPQTDSLRAFDMFLKTQYVSKLNNGGGVVFASGTPIANTIAEMFTVQRYMQMLDLKAEGTSNFDAWASTFGDTVTRLELSPDGSNYKVRTAFAKFTNLPELMNRFKSFADVQTAEMLNLPRPSLRTGKAEVIISPKSEETDAYIKSLIKRVDAIKSGRVDPTQDNMLKVTNDGRKAALDMRLIGAEYRDYPDSKTNKCVEQVFQIWSAGKAEKLTQLIFSDLSVPEKGKYNVYQDVKDKLIAKGAPEGEIAFIHDYETNERKKSLYDMVNAGEIRILIGSTEKMGTGTNVQTLLVAKHDLDAPWRPDQLEQRDGRILRRGNKNKEVMIFRYVTKGTFDAYMWQTLERKARFIDSIMAGKLHSRTAEDVEGRALSAEEVKAAASENPLVIEKIQTDIEIQRLQILEGAYKNAKFNAQKQVAEIPARIKYLKESIPKFKADLEALKSNKSDKFSITIQDKEYSERKQAGEAIVKIASALGITGKKSEIKIGEYNGFDLWLLSMGTIQGNDIYAKGEGANYIGHVSEAVGTIASLDYGLSIKSIEDRITRNETEISGLHKKMEGLKKEIGKPFVHTDKVKELLEKQEKINKQFETDKGENNTEELEGKEEIAKEDSEDTELDSKVTETARMAMSSADDAQKEFVEKIRKEFRPDIPVEPGPVPSVEYVIPTINMIKPMELPEMVRFVKKLTGSVPTLKRFRRSLGKFYGEDRGKIKFDHRIFADVELVTKIVAHEIGHLDDYLEDETLVRGNLKNRVMGIKRDMAKEFGNKTIKNGELRKELIALSEYWRPYDKTTANQSVISYRNSSVELYADAVSVLLNNPGLLHRMAPKFYDAFFTYLDRKESVKDAYFGLMELYNSTTSDLLRERFKERRDAYIKGEEIQKLKRQEKYLRDRRTWELIRQNVDDANYPILKKIKELEAQGVEVPEDMNPKFMLEEVSMTDNMNHLLLAKLDVEVVEPFNKAGISLEDAGDYLLLQRIINERKEIANPFGYTVKSAPVDLDFLRNQLGEERWAILEKGVVRFHDFIFETSQIAVEVGAYNKQVNEEKIIPNREHYASFAVLDYLQAYVPAGIRAQVGTMKEIANPWVITILKTISLNRLIVLQRARNSFRDTWLQYFPGEISRAKIINPGDVIRQFRREPGKEHIEILENGHRVAYNVDPFIARAFDNLGSGDLSATGHLLRKILGTNIFHALLITYNPGFGLYFNPIKDFKDTYTALNALTGKTTVLELLKSYIKALPHAVKRAAGIQDDLVTEMLENFAINVNFNDFVWDKNDDTYEAEMRRYGLIKENANTTRKILLKPVVQLLSAVRFAGSALEGLGKIAGYVELVEKGERGKKLAYETRNYTGTPNWMKKGVMTAVTNPIFMFSNVQKEGFKRSIELATEPKTRGGWWWSTVKMELIPKLLQIIAASGAAGLALKEFYDRVSEYDKANYICIPLGAYPGGKYKWKAVYLRIPHGHTGQLLASMFWKISNAYKNQPGNWQQVLDTGVQQTTTGFAPGITIAQNWLLYLTGKNPYDFFRGRNIIPETDFQAGGWPALKDMIYWTIDQSGQVKIARYDTEKDTTTETTLRVSPVLNRMIKISDYGMVEKEKSVIIEHEQERAQHKAARSQKERIYLQRLFFLRNLKAADTLTPEQNREYNRLNNFYSTYITIDKNIRIANEKGDSKQAEQKHAILRARVNSVLNKVPP